MEPIPISFGMAIQHSRLFVNLSVHNFGVCNFKVHLFHGFVLTKDGTLAHVTYSSSSSSSSQALRQEMTSSSTVLAVLLTICNIHNTSH